MQNEICKLSLHDNPILQLSWSPLTVGVPILFSVTRDELAWWNVALKIESSNQQIKRQQQIQRRSILGIIYSQSTPSFGTSRFPITQMPSSQSVDAGVSDLQYNERSNAKDTSNGSDTYWKNKIGKHPENPSLLTVITLPHSRASKVCISSDFRTYVTSDIYGSISIFKPFDQT